jgi:hypothetical protein
MVVCISLLCFIQQTVVLDGVSSEAVSIDSGVSQVSVLGPGLFLFYINDLQSRLTSKVRLFADDTSIFLIVDNTIESADILNRDLNTITSWSNKWLVSFN